MRAAMLARVNEDIVLLTRAIDEIDVTMKKVWWVLETLAADV
jgi:hypothetical protein